MQTCMYVRIFCDINFILWIAARVHKQFMEELLLLLSLLINQHLRLGMDSGLIHNKLLYCISWLLNSTWLPAVTTHFVYYMYIQVEHSLVYILMFIMSS